MSKEKNTLCFILADHATGLDKTELEYILSELERENLSAKISCYSFIRHEGSVVSFELNRDLSALEHEGSLHFGDEGVTIDRKRILELAYALTYEQQKDIRSAVQKILAKGRSSKTTAASSPKRPSANTLFTAGYEGENIDSLLMKLKRNNITKLVDVRCNPISRKYGFSKKILSDLTARIGIAYEHFPALGIPSESRKDLKSQDDYEALFSDYRENILDKNGAAQADLIQTVRGESAVLVCFEASYKQCHRSHLANSISAKSGMKIVHI